MRSYRVPHQKEENFLEIEIGHPVDVLNEINAGFNLFVGSEWRSCGLDPYEWTVLCNLYSHANSKSKLCCPSARTIAEETQISERKVFTVLRSLESKGFLKHRKRQRENGSDTSNLYTELIHPELRGRMHHMQTPYAPHAYALQGMHDMQTHKVNLEGESKEKCVRATRAARACREFLPPTVEEMIAHGSARGIGEQDCRDLFKIWSDSNWNDGNGKRIKSWKGTMTSRKIHGYLPSDKRNAANYSRNGSSEQNGWIDKGRAF